MKDCVATAPTPASAKGTSPPTANQCDCTATPISPVAGSNATMEKVCTGRSGLSCDIPTIEADRSKAHKKWACRCMMNLLRSIKQRILVYRARFATTSQSCDREEFLCGMSSNEELTATCAKVTWHLRKLLWTVASYAAFCGEKIANAISAEC